MANGVDFWSLRSTAMSAVRFMETYYKAALCRWTYLMLCPQLVTYTRLTVTWCHSECYMPSLQSSWLLHCTLLFVQPFALRALSCCKHDTDPILWLNVKTLKRVPTTLCGKMVRCFEGIDHGRNGRWCCYTSTIRWLVDTLKNTLSASSWHALELTHVIAASLAVAALPAWDNLLCNRMISNL